MRRLFCLVFLLVGAASPLRAQEIKLRSTIECKDGCRCLAISPDGNRIGVGAFLSTKIYDVVSGRVVATFPAPPLDRKRGRVYWDCSLAFSPDGKTLAAGRGDAFAPEVRLWDLASGKNTSRLWVEQGHEKPTDAATPLRVFDSLAFSLDGEVLAAGGGDSRRGEVSLWDAATGTHLGDLPVGSRSIVSVAFSPDGKWLAVGGVDGLSVYSRVAADKSIAFGEKAENASFREMALHGAAWPDWDWVTFSPDGKTLASIGGPRRTVTLWDVASGNLLSTHDDYGGYVAFLSDGKTLVSLARDENAIRLWDITTGKTVASASTDQMLFQAFVLSPDRKVLAATGEEKIRLWDLKPR